MPAQGSHQDSASDLLSRMNGLKVRDSPDEPYTSSQQVGSYHQQAASYHQQTGAYPQEPPVRGPTYAAHQSPRPPPFSGYMSPQGFTYYSANVDVDASHGGGNMPGSYQYGGLAIDLGPGSVPTTPSYSNFPSPGTIYGADNQMAHDNQLQLQQQQQVQQHGDNNMQPYRPPHVQQALQQQAAYQLQAEAAATASMYGYQDLGQYWTPYQGVYSQQGGEKQHHPHQRTNFNQPRKYKAPNNARSMSQPGIGFAGQGSAAANRFTGKPIGAATAATNTINNSSRGSITQWALQRHTSNVSNPYDLYGGREFSRWRGLGDANLVNSALLEDFKLNRMKRWELKDIIGHASEFAADQHGSRFIQQKLESAAEDERQTLFDEILPNAYRLMMDMFGNYVMQRMFEFGEKDQIAALGKTMLGHVLILSMNVYGCRVVQKALEHVTPEQQQLLIDELVPHYLECVRSSNANHVVQRLIALDPPQSLMDAFCGHVQDLSKHAYGCRVLQKTFETVDEDRKRPLLEEMHLYTLALIEDQFGNYVVQSVIASGIPADRDRVIQVIKGKVLQLARQKFASNAIEKAISNAEPDDRRQLIDELIGSNADGTNNIGMLLRDAYGNFPLQTALMYAEPDQREMIADIVAPLIRQLRNTPVGKRLGARISQLEDEGLLSIFTSTSMHKSLSSSTSMSEITGGLSMSRTTSSSTGPTSPEPGSSLRNSTLVSSGVRGLDKLSSASRGSSDDAKTLQEILP
ncbi:hypothetical protein IAR55_000139 [Kwoniella newhampshirensis]|uniref:PUM-HD domain-containing protein n=1 Tax=Kwoniella newhampshirensis TaxID=1651941 RepID=A0AAW0Z5W8_9TREE